VHYRVAYYITRSSFFSACCASIRAKKFQILLQFRLYFHALVCAEQIAQQQGDVKNMKQVSKGRSRQMTSFAVAAIIMAAVTAATVQAKEWEVTAGAESPGLGSQALAFLPNELWINTGDSIRWTFPTHERHTITFMRPGQTRPASFGPVFGIPVGCPGLLPDGSVFDGSGCVTSGILRLDENTTTAPTYSVSFPTAGNFKFVCLVHADMTGVVHVLSLSDPLPHDQDFYDTQALRNQLLLVGDASSLEGQTSRRGGLGGAQSNEVTAGVGEIITTTGAGSQTASLMRFLRDTIVVHVGDTVEWTMLDPSISHTVTFGTEPADPRPSSANVTLTSDGARQAVIVSATDNVNSGFLTGAPQDRATLAQAPPGVTRFRVTFTVPGTFNYICAIHDELNMLGTVIVH
jgi:plastocyanin